MHRKWMVASGLLAALAVGGGNSSAAKTRGDRQGGPDRGGAWVQMSRPELVAVSTKVLNYPDIPFRAREEIIRVRALEMDWDIGAMVYEPEDASRIPRGADGNKIGLFLLHGGSGDHRSMDKFARFLTAKFGYKIVNMSYPGRLNLLSQTRDWPGDTINRDKTVRTPVWHREKAITPDQYKVVEDREEARRRRWGTLILACAQEGTEFYDRMAGWPVAFEEGGKELLRRHLPAPEFSIYAHGHSTGGPFTMIFSQRVPNLAGIIGMESSPFGAMYGELLRKFQDLEEPWEIGFNCLRIRTWRDTARYAGYEAIQEEGVKALERLPMLMEEILESWSRSTTTAQFKAENIIHFDSPAGLTAAAQATAKRLNLPPAEASALVTRYLGYRRELSGSGVKPVPPVLSLIAKNSRDHTEQGYRQVYLPFYASMKPAPKVRIVQVDAGTHGYSSPESGLPMGIAPVGAFLWHQAITGGFFKAPSTQAPAQVPAGGSPREPFAPFRVIGNIHYVGSSNAGSFLVTTPDGHILIDSGYPQTESWVRASIERLGFRLTDIKVILNTHAHADHVGGHAQFKEWTGARVLTSEADKPVIADGGRSDFRSDGRQLWKPLVADGTIRDGETIRLGNVTLVAHLTPGHTRGNTTWTMAIDEGGRKHNVVFVGSMGLNRDVALVGNTKYPGIADDYTRSFAVLKNLPSDVFFAFHADHYGLVEKKRRLDEKASPNPFIDPDGLPAYIQKSERAFMDQLTKERAGGRSDLETGGPVPRVK